ncbi:MAG: hypothetical protein AB7E81_16360 [Hyphomicrobiaceae bacterium]
MRGVLRITGEIIAIAMMTLMVNPFVVPTTAVAQDGARILDRNMDVSRERAADRPRSEGDQSIIGGWPLYRTERGQSAYNAAMATLAATDFRAPNASAFRECVLLDCELELPRMTRDGWIPSGRIWVSPTEYVLVAHSPRPMRRGRQDGLRSYRSMRYFVFHEFHNSSHNTDTYDTISSHNGRVFVPFYLSKVGLDARGHRYVVIVQVAPYNVVSVHATNYGSAGPGVEVAKNMTDALESLQERGGIVLASIVKRAAPQLRVVNHRGREGLPMLESYERRLEFLRTGRGRGTVALPFFAAQPSRIASVQGGLANLIARPGRSRQLAVAERAFVPPRSVLEQTDGRRETASADDVPQLVGPIQLARRPDERPRQSHGPVLVRPVQLLRQSAFAPNFGQ